MQIQTVKKLCHMNARIEGRACQRTDTMARKFVSRSVERIERIEDAREVNSSILAATGSYSTLDVAGAIQVHWRFRNPPYN